MLPRFEGIFFLFCSSNIVLNAIHQAKDNNSKQFRMYSKSKWYLKNRFGLHIFLQTTLYSSLNPRNLLAERAVVFHAVHQFTVELQGKYIDNMLDPISISSLYKKKNDMNLSL